MLRAALAGDVNGVQSAIGQGGNVDVEIDNPDNPLPLDGLIASVAGASPAVLQFTLANGHHSRTAKIHALNAAINFEDVASVKLLSEALKPFTTDDQPVIYSLAARAPDEILPTDCASL